MPLSRGIFFGGYQLNKTEKVAVETLMREQRFEDALLMSQGVLSNQPQNVDAHYYAAVCLRYLARYELALETLGKIKKIAPGHSRASQEMGHVYRAIGDLQQALQAYARATQTNASLVASWKGQIDILLKYRRKSEAARLMPYFERVAKMPPTLVAAMDSISQGRLVEAEELCRQFLIKVPHHVEAMRLLAAIGVKLNVMQDAEFLLESALKLAPDNVLLRVEYIEVLRKRQKIALAYEAAKTLIEEYPEDVHYKSLYAVLCMQKGDYESALDYFDKVLQRMPGDPVTLTSKGHALKTCGNSHDAIDAYRAAAKTAPAFGEAWHSLANLKTFSFTDEDIAQMQTQLKGHELRFMDRVYINFALGKALEDQHDFASAFAHYTAGNSAKKASSRYKPEQITGEFEQQKSVFSDVRIDRFTDSGCTAQDPIFILGLPRAGSTLLEQILSSHSQVDGTLELPNILSMVADFRRDDRLTGENRYPRILNELSAETYRDLGEKYLKDTQMHRQGAPFFIDKMPNNFRHIGLIKLILPNAKIIDARRHPMACCFSGYKQLFAEGQEFTNDLAYAGRYYRDYVDLMDFWQARFPEQILQVEYETVVNDFESQVKTILDYCGLPFEPACLSFYKTERAVRTPSSEQVRQPIFKSGLDQWRNFETHLQPLKEALGPVLERYPIS